MIAKGSASGRKYIIRIDLADWTLHTLLLPYYSTAATHRSRVKRRSDETCTVRTYICCADRGAAAASFLARPPPPLPV